MNRNTDSHNTNRYNKKSFFRFLKDVLFANGIVAFDGFPYSNQYSEKLPIIYANIRV